MELASIHTPAAALIAGLVTSLHCAGMCGPLTCLLAPARADGTDPFTVATVYHLARLAGYGTLGALAGGLGRVPLGFFGDHALRLLPWVLVGFFVITGLRLERYLPKPALMVRLQWRVQAALRGRSRLRVAAFMGAATPLLPCGPLYFLIALSALTGSALRGVEFMLAFGLGTVPLLWLVQTQYGRWRSRLTPVRLVRLRTGLSLLSAAIITWRLQGPGAGDFLCN